jgi:hypothetical protein
LITTELNCFRPDIPTSGDEDSYDEFDLDGDIFDNIYDHDGTHYSTSNSTVTAPYDSSTDVRDYEPKKPPGKPDTVPPQPHLSSRLFKTSPKPIQTPLPSMSPFLRSSLPEPTPSAPHTPMLNTAPLNTHSLPNGRGPPPHRHPPTKSNASTHRAILHPRLFSLRPPQKDTTFHLRRPFLPIRSALSI